jgi:hypothetical protein
MFTESVGRNHTCSFQRMSIMKRLAVVCAVMTMTTSGAAFAQTRELSSADSAQLRVATVAVLLDSAGPSSAREMRIWVGGGEDLRPSISDTVWQVIADSFPTARLMQPGDTVFLCPAGKPLSMPGSACPIRDDGVVVRLNVLRAYGDSAIATGFLVRSEVSPSGRHMTWGEGLSLVFEQRDGVWRLRAIRGRAVT